MNPAEEHHLSAETLERLRSWFSAYVQSFASPDPVVRQGLLLKEEHSRQVSREICRIGSDLGLRDDGLRLAEAVGLLHDIGRFRQYSRYGTYVDGKSEDHAALGARVLRQEKALTALEPGTRKLILKAVAYHNRLSLPTEETPACLFFSRLVRDADKLDIFRVVSHYYYCDASERSAAVELDLPDVPEVSGAVLKAIRKGRLVRMGDLQSLNDFKLMQMAWVFDINFQPTLRMIRDRGNLEMIRQALPASAAIDRVYGDIQSYLDSRLREPLPASAPHRSPQ